MQIKTGGNLQLAIYHEEFGLDIITEALEVILKKEQKLNLYFEANYINNAEYALLKSLEYGEKQDFFKL